MIIVALPYAFFSEKDFPKEFIKKISSKSDEK